MKPLEKLNCLGRCKKSDILFLLNSWSICEHRSCELLYWRDTKAEVFLGFSDLSVLQCYTKKLSAFLWKLKLSRLQCLAGGRSLCFSYAHLLFRIIVSIIYVKSLRLDKNNQPLAAQFHGRVDLKSTIRGESASQLQISRVVFARHFSDPA